LAGWHVILALKTAVVGVTLLLLASFLPLSRGNYRLHGRINMVFTALTFAALFALEFCARVIDPSIFDYFDDDARRALSIHLCLSIPAACLLPLMLYSGLSHRRRLHLTLASVFGVFWTGTFITGIFFLPHAAP
jgi:hypothetical protein